jgi:DNA-binding CsgD family transcriptional regulator
MDVTPQVLSETIGEIYDCAVDPARWTETLPRLRRLFRCENAMLALTDLTTGQTPLSAHDNVAPEWLACLPRYSAGFAEAWRPFLLDPDRPLDEAVSTRRFLPAEIFETNAYYREWCRPQGLVDSYGLMMIRDSGHIASIGLGRHESVGFVTEPELRMFGLLAPHLRRAVVISRVLDVSAIAAAAFEATLDALRVAVFIVDGSARMMHANRAGHILLDAADTVRLKGAMLTGHNPIATQALIAAVLRAAENEAGLGAAGIGVPLVSRGGGKHVAHVLPLAGERDRRPWIRGAAAAVFVAPAGDPTVPVEALTALYDLTPAEARVMVMVARGRAPAETAEVLGISEKTVKTHLSRIFAKTGTGRQTDLALLVQSLALSV